MDRNAKLWRYKIKSFDLIIRNIEKVFLNLKKIKELKSKLDKYTVIDKKIYEVMLNNTIEKNEDDNRFKMIEQNINNIECN